MRKKALIIGTLMVVFLALLSIRLKRPAVPSPTPMPLVRGDPVPFAVHGKQEYAVSRGSGSRGPTMDRVSVEPIDPNVGDNQTMRVQVRHNKPVKSVMVTLASDTKKKTTALSLTSGTNTDGTWEGSWTIDGPIDYVYNATIEAKDGKDTATIDIMFRP